MYTFKDYWINENDSEDHAVIITQREVNVTNDIILIQKRNSQTIDKISSRPHNYNIYTVHRKLVWLGQLERRSIYIL
jgi:hypothetical protein